VGPPPGDGRVRITGPETCCGFGPDHLGRIVDRFYRADASRTSVGAGLGLALVQTIMTLHQGSVTATSELGRGATFQLAFPDSPPSDNLTAGS